MGPGLCSQAPGHAGGSQANAAENKAVHVGPPDPRKQISLPGQSESLAKDSCDPSN